MTSKAAAASILHRRALCCVVFVALFSLWSLPTTNALSDVQILLDLAAATGIKLSGWNSSNVQNLCSTWDRVTCDESGRVSRLELIPEPKTIPIMRGKMPDSILGLTNLTSFQVGYNAIWGDFPAGMFELPVIRDVILSSTGLTVRFPSVVSPTIKSVFVTLSRSTWLKRYSDPVFNALRYVDDTNLVTPLFNHANWDQVGLLDLRYSGFKCPLPQTFVDYHSSGNIFGNCRMQGNFLDIQDNKLCGRSFAAFPCPSTICPELNTISHHLEVPLAALGCNILPMAYAAPFFPSDDVTVNAQRRVSFTGHFIEFIGREIYISAAYQSRGVSRAYRGEYIAIQAQPISELTNLPHANETFYNHNVSTWGSFASDSPTKIRANLTAVNDVVVEYVFEERISTITDRPYIKFALNVYNMGREWIKDTLNASNDLDVSISFGMNYRIQHSLENGPYVACTTPPGLAVLANCSGPIGSFQIEFSLASGGFLATAKTNKTQLSYEYSVVGFVDGEPLQGDNAAVFLARIPHPLPSALWLEKVKQANGSVIVPAMPESTQSVSIPIEISVIRFKKAVFYDPDISITLLFDPSQADPSSTPQQAADIQTGITIGVIVAIVVVAVVVAIGVTVFAVVVFPYLKARQAASSQPEIESENNTPLKTDGSWKPARATSKD